MTVQQSDALINSTGGKSAMLPLGRTRSDLDMLECAEIMCELSSLIERDQQSESEMKPVAEADPQPARPILINCFTVPLPKKKRTRTVVIIDIDLNKEPPKKKRCRPVGSDATEQQSLERPKKMAKPKPKKKAITAPQPKNNPFPSQDMSAGLKDHIERVLHGTNVHLVIEKVLTTSDVKVGLNRLMMPLLQIKSPQFLMEEEREYLKVKVGKEVNGIEVSLIEPLAGPGGPPGKVTLKRWVMEKKNGSSATVSYVLITGWNDVVSRNGLKAGNAVQVWSFRVGPKLHLALVRV